MVSYKFSYKKYYSIQYILFICFYLYIYIPIIGKLLSIINGTSSKVYDSNPYNVREHFFMADEKS
jgi:uncharacterized membrane protein